MLNRLIDKIKAMYAEMIESYPMTCIMLIIGTLYECIYTGAELNYGNALKGTWEFLFELLVFEQLAVWFAESLPKGADGKNRKVAMVINSVLAFIFSIFTTGGFMGLSIKAINQINDSQIAYWVFAYILIQVIYAFRCKYIESGLEFEKYITSSFVKATQISIIWGVLALGLFILGFIFSELIVDMDDWIFAPQVLVIGLYVIPSAVMALHKAEEKIGRFFEGLIRYALLIMTIVGAAIIYIYMIKIVAIREIPSNSVFAILAALFFVAIPTGYMCTSLGREGVLLKLAWILPYIYAPFIILQIYSVVSRIMQYGVTASRYMGIVLIMLEIIYIVVYAVRRERMSDVLYCFIAATIISCIVPGVNAVSVSRMSQKAVINKYIEDPAYGMSNAKRVLGAYKYLLSSEGEDYVDAILTREQQSAISDMGLMTGDYVFRDYSERAFLNGNDSFMPVSGFDYIAGFDAYWQEYDDLADFPIEIDGVEVGRFDLTQEVESVIERVEASADYSTVYGVDEINVSDDCKLYITYVELVYDGETREISTFRISGHLVCTQDYYTEMLMGIS